MNSNRDKRFTFNFITLPRTKYGTYFNKTVLINLKSFKNFKDRRSQHPLFQTMQVEAYLMGIQRRKSNL